MPILTLVRDSRLRGGGKYGLTHGIMTVYLAGECRYTVKYTVARCELPVTSLAFDRR